jgi:hypothetical protein
VSWPSHELQRSIVNVLAVLDDNALNRATNDKLAELGSALFTSWFVDFDPIVAKRDGRMPVGVPTEAINSLSTHFEEVQVVGETDVPVFTSSCHVALPPGSRARTPEHAGCPAPATPSRFLAVG